MQWDCDRCFARSFAEEPNCWCCGRARSKASRIDLGAPRRAEVDSRSTDGAKGPQIDGIQHPVVRTWREPSDAVNSPEHYRWLPVEAIEITEHFNFCMGNALKYILRADHKGKPIEDIRKSIWYLQRELENRERGVSN